MGTWAEGIFESDTACEWADELARLDRPEHIAVALCVVIQGSLGLDECQVALAAAEVVAALRGHPLRGLYPSLKEWLRTSSYQSTADEQRLALEAIAVIRDRSELADEMGRNNQHWLAQLEKLTDRLRHEPTARPPAQPKVTHSPELTAAIERLDLERNSIQLTNAGSVKSLDLCNHDDATLHECLAWLTTSKRIWFAIGDNDIRNTDAAFTSLDRCTKLEELNLSGTLITDGTLSRIAGLWKLKRLLLARTPITDAGLRSLAGLVNLEELDLSAPPGRGTSQLTGAGLVCLRGMTKLSTLNLQGTGADDSVLEWLASMPNLCHLDLRHTKVKGADQKWHHRELPSPALPVKAGDPPWFANSFGRKRSS